MNLSSIEIERKAAENARKLLAQAVRNEPQITADLREIASEVAAEIVGLEHKFKTEKSLTRKIFGNAEKLLKTLPAEQFSNFQEIEKYILEIAEKSNDALRYTFVFPLEIYVSSFGKTLSKLGDYGCKKTAIWNAWKNVETLYDTGYRGINVIITSSHGQKFELQFHTMESFELKMKTHRLYKMAVSVKISAEIRKQIIQTMRGLAKDVAMPEGAKKL